MTEGPCILDEQGMVMIDGGYHCSRRVLQNSSEIGIGDVAVFAGAHTPWVPFQETALAAAVHCACSIANPGGGGHLHLRYIPVLINYVPQTVELVTDFEVVGSPPSALEESYILV